MANKTPFPPVPWAATHLWETRVRTLLIICTAMSLMGVGEGFIILAALGSSPWTVFAQGIALQTGLSIGTVIGLVSLVVLLLWIPFKLRPGLGTILNILLIALFVDLTVQHISAPELLFSRTLLMVSGVLIFGVGTTFYLSCRLGAGPRDGLMVGICQRYGWRVGVVRTSIEVSVCVLGALLGGNLGVSTVIFALSVGWIIQGTVVLLEKRFGNR